jgi:hypothetical protein
MRTAAPGLSPYQQLVRQVRQDLRRWLAKARRAGLDEESIEALFMITFRTAAAEDIA